MTSMDEGLDEVLSVPKPPRRVEWREILFKKWDERSWEETVQLFGMGATQVAHVIRTIEAQDLRPPTISMTPRVFVSYRHGSDAHNRWVGRLAKILEERGYIVISDVILTDRSPSEIAGLVAQISTCHFFVVVIDSRYVESVSDIHGEPATRTWAYLELKIAEYLTWRCGTRTCSLLLEGQMVPPGMTLSDGFRTGTAFSVNTPEKLYNVLDLFFPKLVVANSTATEEAGELMSQSKSCSFEGDHQTAFRLAQVATGKLPESAEVWNRLCLAAIALSEIETAIQAARKAAELVPTDTFIRCGLIFAELVGGNQPRAKELMHEVAHLFTESWRFKALQLGIEVVDQEQYPMESCARAVSRLTPMDLILWTRRWRQEELAIGRNELSVYEFPHGVPLPISTTVLQGHWVFRIVQSDKVKRGNTSVEGLPVLELELDGASGYFHADLDMLLLAYLAARWLPAALKRPGWDYISPNSGLG